MPVDPNLLKPLLDQFATQSFRDVADGDYIAARMAYRAELLIQALWSSEQAIEKYLKAILLYRRIPYTKRTHSLVSLLKCLEQTFPLILSNDTRKFIEFIDDWNVDRYFTFPYGTSGLELIQLDSAVWEIRRYCFGEDPRLSPTGHQVSDLDLRYVENALGKPPRKLRARSRGELERVLENSKNPARPSLIWNNLYFGSAKRKSIRRKQAWVSANSPLSRHPEILDELRKYIFLPKVD